MKIGNDICDCVIGYNEFDFFKKIKNTDPLMGAKLKSKTHLQNTFLKIFEPFFACLASKFSKSANMTKKIFWCKKSKKISKNAEFHADFESVEKLIPSRICS
jgi:hypothetical protein